MQSTPSKSVFALVDGNNFYVSCERVFNPALENRPIVVLSNNDGCAVSRSQEAKDMGVAMGQPWFEMRHLERRGLIALSSNYTLYADMSARMMSLAAQFCPRQEVYSIDESFLEFEGFSRYQLTDHCRQLRERVRKWIGIPVCVGLGSTKTLAKLANRIAKKSPDMGGVCNLDEISERDRAQRLALVPVSDVWGIGHRTTEKLNKLGIRSAQDLASANTDLMRLHFGVQIERTVRELNGLSCYVLENEPPPKQQIVSSLSFGRLVTDLNELREAVQSHVARAGEKLRGQNSTCMGLAVFLGTHPFLPDEPQYHPMSSASMPYPALDGFSISRVALKILDAIYRPGYRYKKAGVMLLDLAPAGKQQGSLFKQPLSKHVRLSHLVDDLNDQMGRGTIQMAGAGTKIGWSMKRERMSPAFTSSWREIMRARAI